MLFRQIEYLSESVVSRDVDLAHFEIHLSVFVEGHVLFLIGVQHLDNLLKHRVVFIHVQSLHLLTQLSNLLLAGIQG